LALAEEIRVAPRCSKKWWRGTATQDKAMRSRKSSTSATSVHEIIQRLHHTFVTLSIRRTFTGLARSLDDVMDAIDATRTCQALSDQRR
jgi:uncharacterized protein Yka (UPF0111/DUF47 family)